MAKLIELVLRRRRVRFENGSDFFTTHRVSPQGLMAKLAELVLRRRRVRFENGEVNISCDPHPQRRCRSRRLTQARNLRSQAWWAPRATRSLRLPLHLDLTYQSSDKDSRLRRFGKQSTLYWGRTGLWRPFHRQSR